MKDREKIDWMRGFMAIWGIVLALMCVLVFLGASPGPDFFYFIRGLMGVTLGATVMTLLILSWRAAFLSGRKG